jgi:crossover junction endodeoxyribonuclease RusA
MIELPFPAKILWPNGRGHHMAKHREFQKHKQWAFGATLAAKISPPVGKVRWSATFYPKTKHGIDDDNARSSLKAYQDGIAKALVIDDKHFEAPVLHFAEPVKNGRVVIVIGSDDIAPFRAIGDVAAEIVSDVAKRAA